MSTHSASARGLSSGWPGTRPHASARTCIAVCALFAVVACLPARAAAQATIETVTTFASVPPYRVTGPVVRDADGTVYGAGASGGSLNTGGIFRIDSNGVLTSLHDFTGPDGDAPYGGLVRGPDDALYGTTSAGGAHGTGTIFRITSDGTFSTLHSFAAVDPNTGTAPEGAAPRAPLVAAGGRLYGVTESGGATAPGRGVIFSVTPDGQFAIEHEFTAAASRPQAGLTLASDNALYGTVTAGGADNLGGVFRFVPGAGITMLHAFSSGGATFPDGYNVQAPLAEGVDGALYGTTVAGGQNQLGTVFRIALDGTWSVLHSFAAADPNTGVAPEGFFAVNGLTRGLDGNLYGIASQGGENRRGVLYRVDSSGTFSVQRALLEEGGNVVAPLVGADDGRLYGTSQIDGAAQNGTVFAFDPASVSTQILHAFVVTGPGQVLAALTRGDDGQLYGLGYDGGGNGSGVIFRLSPSGTVTILHLFSGPDGANPYAPLTKGPDGAFYGTTTSGGRGQGTVFRITAEGAFTVLHAFAEPDANGVQLEGAHPYGGVAVAPDGTVFGVTSDGGAYGAGTIFSIANGAFRVHHAFGADESAALVPVGAYPQAGMAWGPDGRLYGSTSSGPDQAPFGSVFAFDPVTRTVTGLASLTPDGGYNIWSAPSLADDGRLYFAAADAGPGGAGAVLRYDPSAAELTAVTGFTGGIDGAQPYAAPVQGADGALYGATSGAGANGYGTLYRLPLDGNAATLHAFAFAAPGGMPVAGLVELQPGVFYGATGFGATGSAVFRATVPIAEQENHPPSAASTSLAATEDTPAAGVLSGTDADGDALTFSLVTNGSKGTVTLTDPSTGTYTYVPHANANGTDSFTFRARDGVADSNIATVAVTIAPVNDVPVLQVSPVSTPEDVQAHGRVTGTDVDGDVLSFTISVNGSTGLAVIDAATGAFTYTPAANAIGSDSFTVRANDGAAWSEPAVVPVSITPVNDPPLAAPRTLFVVEDTPASGTLAGSDVDGDALTYAVVSAPAKGTVQIVNAATGAFLYTPAANANGADAFTYRVHDGTVSSAPATVTIAIAPVNDAPVASNGSATTSGGVATGAVKASDVDGPALSYVLVTNGAKGAVTLDAATGAFRYTAAAGATGEDQFTYRASDGTLMSNVATVTIRIAGGNAPPVASNGALTTKEDRAAFGWLRASDPERKRLAYRIVSGPARGRVFLLNKWTGQYLYVPKADANGPDAFTFAASDGSSSSNVGTVRVTILPVNDRPVARAGWISTRRNVPVAGRVTAWDVDHDRLTFSVLHRPRRGTVRLDVATGAFTYTPQKGHVGGDEFTVRVSDGFGGLDFAAVRIVVKR